MATEIEPLLDYALQVGASEVIVTEGAPAAVRLAGKVCVIPEAPAVDFGALRNFLGSMDGESGVMMGGPWCNSRWRVRYCRAALGNTAVFRPVLDECPDFSAIGVPDTMASLLGLSSGLVVFAGPACSGKTTTATAYVSAMCAAKILRVSLLNPREELKVKKGSSLVLEDSHGDTCEKITQALRSGTDLIWLGDFEGLQLIPMLKAAEAGALVVVNVTAGNTAGVMEALLASETPENRGLARQMLASVLKAVVVQRLVIAAEGNGAVPAWEIMYGTQKVSSIIRSGEIYTLPSIIAASASDGMMLMDDCLSDMVKAGYIPQEEAAKYAANPSRMG